MDNTFFVGLTGTVSGIMESGLIAIVPVVIMILGALVGYRLYKKFTTTGDNQIGPDGYFR